MISQPIGAARIAPACRRGRPWKRPASLRPTDLFGAGALTPAASTIARSANYPRSALDLGPSLDPIVERDARLVVTTFTTVGHRGLPEVDLVPERLVVCVIVVAVVSRAEVGRVEL